MSGAWFNVDINSLQSSILDSVNEASKIMDELNLDNMQEDSGLSNKTSQSSSSEHAQVHVPVSVSDNGDDKVAIKQDELVYSTTTIDNQSLNVQDYNYIDDSVKTGNHKINTEENENLPDNEEELMEEVIEFTEFGVPIRIKQPKQQSNIPPVTMVAAQSSKEENMNSDENDGEEEEEETSHSFSIWNLDSLQESDKPSKNSKSKKSEGAMMFQNIVLAPSSQTSEEKASLSDLAGYQSSLPQYVSPSLMSEYLHPVSAIFSAPEDDNEVKDEQRIEEDELKIAEEEPQSNVVDNCEGRITINEDDEQSFMDQMANEQTQPANYLETTSFFGAATSTLLQNAKANIPNSIFTKPSFFDDDDSDDDDHANDPIYLRVEQNKINPPPPRSSQQSIFQSGSAFFATPPPDNNITADLTRAEVRRQSRAYGIVSKAITCVMWLLRLVWNILSAIFEKLVNIIRSMFDCPSSESSNSILPTAVTNNFCEALQHPVTRARLFAEYRGYILTTVVSNNFIAVMTTLLLAVSYWKFRRYGTDSGD